jgi:hypothetical protein
MDILLAVLSLVASILLKPSVIVGIIVLGFIYLASGIPFPKFKITLCAYLWPKIVAAVEQLFSELTGKQLYVYLILGGLYLVAPNIIVWAFLVYLAFRVIVTNLPEITAALVPLFKKA